MRLPSLILATSFGLAGCATGATAQPGVQFPSRGDAAADGGPGGDAGSARADGAPQDAVTRDADPGANADFEAAVAKARGTDPPAATQALDGFLLRHPRSPHRTVVTALLARLALDRNDLDAARTRLEREGPPEGDANLRFVAGLLESRRGNAARARQLLEPFAASGPPSLAGVAGPQAQLELSAAQARSAADLNEPGVALSWWARYAHGAKPHERAYARDRATAIAGRLAPEDALRLWETDKQPLVRLAVAAKAAAAMQARGDLDAGRRINDELERLRRTMDADEPGGTWTGRGDPSRFGLAVPMSGRTHQLGAAVSRGAMLALGEAAARSESGRPGPQLVLRNTQDEGRGPAAAVAELAREEAVIGVVGTADPRAAEQLGRDGVPFLVLDDEAPGGGGTAFQMVHAPEARAAALARHALAGGLRSFAVLAPDAASGKRFTEAFKRTVVAGGGRVVAEVGYVAGSTSFARPVRDLQKATFEALFVPEDSDRLELIAPALAVGDLWARPLAEVPPAGRRADKGSDGKPRGRGILLLSTARGLSPRMLERAGRYVQGAVLAPGYYADAGNAASGRFVASFRGLFNSAPGAAEAYAYDGVHVLRSCVERGATSRDAVLRLLGSETFEGTTGALRFGPDHGRIDPPLLYEIAAEEIRAVR